MKRGILFAVIFVFLIMNAFAVVADEEIERFTVDTELIKVVSELGDTSNISIKIYNPTGESVLFYVDTYLDEFVNFSDSEFHIGADEEKEIIVTFHSVNSDVPDVYLGEVSITALGMTKKIPILFELNDKQVPFDLKLNIPEDYKEMVGGEKLLSELTVFNLEDEEAEISLKYFVKDFVGNLILTQTDIISVKQHSSSLSREIELPGDLKLGNYALIVKSNYKNLNGMSSNIFYVVGEKIEKGFFALYWHYILFGVVMILILFFVLLVLFEQRELRNSLKIYPREIAHVSRRIKEGNLKLPETSRLSSRLKYRLGMLTKAYSQKFITKTAFERGKNRIQHAIEKLEKAGK